MAVCETRIRRENPSRAAPRRFGAQMLPERLQELAAIGRVAIDAQLDFEVPCRRPGRHELAGRQLGGDRTPRQPRHAFAFHHELFQHFGHVGFIVQLQRRRIRGAIEQQREAAPEVAGVRIGDQRQRVLLRSGKAKCGRRPAVGPAGRHQRVEADRHVFVPDRVQMERQLRMVIGEHQLAVAVDEHQDRIVDIRRNDACPHLAEMRRKRLEPGRQEIQRDRMARRDLQALARDALLGADDRACVEQAAEDVFRRLAKQPPCRCQYRRKAAAVDQFGADPLLERLDATAEARLRDVAELRRPGKALILSEGDEILDPLDFHVCLGGLQPDRLAADRGHGADRPGAS